jgi:type I restriction enzyme S subunit
MIANLKPYAEYRIAEGGWIGEVPAHWTVRRMKYALREIDSRSTTGKEQLLRISQYTGVTQRRGADGTDEADTRAGSLVGYKRVEPDDLVINIMLAWNGSMGVSRFDGIASPAYCVYRFGPNAHPWYFHNLLRSPAYKARIKASSTGVVESRLRLYSDDLGRIEALLPPPEEQVAIVRFLDWANGRLERTISAKRKVIALLNEQKQAIIHRAVTRGLDPSVPLKDSGIPWLGEIPVHWEVRRLKQLCAAIVDCKNRTPDMIEGGEYTVVRTTNIRNGVFNPQGSFSTDRRNFEIWTQRGAPRSGDIFFTREAPVGEACHVSDLKNICMGQRMMYFRPDPVVLDADFLLNSIYGPVVRRYIDIAVNGSTVGHLRLGQISALPLLWCPIKEQREIASHIASESAPLKVAISRLEREIDLLHEYRTRLVADVVTGKLDVREAAARLPDETPADIPADGADLLAEDEQDEQEAAA